MSQKRVIVTSEKPDELTEQLQDQLDKQAAITAGTTGIVITNWVAATTVAQAAQTAMATKAPGTSKTRDDAFTAMFIEEEFVMADLQKKVDQLAGTIDAKIALALSNGFQVVDFGTINKQDFVVVDGPASGSAKLVAKGAKEDSFHEWYDSIDKGMSWRYIEPSFKANKVAAGYTPGERVTFKHRIWLRSGASDWHYADLIIR